MLDHQPRADFINLDTPVDDIDTYASPFVGRINSYEPPKPEYGARQKPSNTLYSMGDRGLRMASYLEDEAYNPTILRGIE